MKLGLFTVREGGKYSEEKAKGISVDFEKSKMAKVTGDNDEGKSTILVLFKLILGAMGGKEILNDLVNMLSGKLDAEQRFQGNNKKWYTIRLTKSQFYVREDGSTKDEPAPKNFIESHLGTVAADPMKYKNVDVDEVVKWLAGFSKRGAEEFQKQMGKHKEAIKKASGTRAEANKEAKARRTLLQGAGYADDGGQIIEAKWTESEKKYATKPDITELSTKLTRAGTKSDKFVENETKVAGQKSRKTQIEAQIAALQKELLQVDENIYIGEKWLADNANAKKEYDAIKKEYDNVAKDSQAYESWQTILRYKKELDEWEDLAQTAAANVDKAEKAKQELQWEVIPDTKDVEIVLEDEPDRKAGLYLKKFNSRQMSATQYLVAIVNILRKLGCKILVLDDLSTYGSDFIEQLEKLKKEGWYILTAEMKRNQELEIEYA